MESDRASRTAATSAAPSSSSSHDNHFPFLKLAAEIRLVIYREALLHDDPLLFSVQRPEEGPSGPLMPEAGTSDPETASVRRMLQRDEHGRSSFGQQECQSVAMETWRAPQSISFDDFITPQTPFAQDTSFQLVRNGGPSRRWKQGGRSDKMDAKGPAKAASEASLVPAMLGVNKQIHREASRILYAENVILLDLHTAIYSVNSLQQRTRSLFKHIRIDITSHHDILDGFSDLVRVGLRYCRGLQTLTIKLPGGWSTLDSGGDVDVDGAYPAGRARYTRNNVYANAFHILRWLPKQTRVILEGQPSAEIKKVVAHREKAALELNEGDYEKRQYRLDETA